MAAFQHNTESLPGEFNILLISNDAKVREKLAKSIVMCSLKDYKQGPIIRVHGVEVLPNNVTKINSNFIVFLVDASHKRENKRLEVSLSEMDTEYFAKGACCFLVLNLHARVNDYEELKALGKKWNCPLINCEHDDGIWIETTRRLVKLAMLQMGFIPGLRYSAFKNYVKNVATIK